MALATNTTPGSVVLGGDLTGSAYAPSLRPTGVIPGTYGPVDFVVDAKGRLIYARTSTWAEIEPYTSLASGSVLGTVTVGTGLAVSSGNLTLNAPTATSGALGLMQVGSGLAVTVGGVVSLNAPVATTGSTGIVQVGSGLSVTGAGVVSRTNYIAATDATPGLMQVGSGLSVTVGGVVSLNAPVATTGSTGIVRISSGSGLSISGNTMSMVEGTNSTKGIVNSANTSNITITAGAVDVGPNVGVFSAPNTFTKAQYNAVIQLPTGTASPNLSLYNIFDCGANAVSFTAPSNAATGAEMSILGFAGTGVVNWTARTLPTAQQWAAVAWNGTVFCAVGGITGATQAAATSPDGITWTYRVMPSTQQWSDITWNATAGVFCAISLSSVAATSPDGITWTTRTLPASRQWWAITTNTAGLMVAIAATGGVLYIATSPTGATWTARTSPTGSYGSQWCDVAWNGTVFCAVTYGSSNAATSPDGITWTQRTLPNTNGHTAIAWNGTVFCVVGQIANSCITSPDGITWTQRTMPSAQAWTSVIWNGTTFIAGSTVPTTPTPSGTPYATSTDGITWYQYLAPVAQMLGLAWNGSVVCAVGSVWPNVTTNVSLTGIYTGIGTLTPSTTFSPAYKISGIPTLGQYVLDCVTVGSNTYCQYNQ